MNSDKGKRIFSEIAAEGIYCNKIEMASGQYETIPNRVQPDMYRHPNRERFLGLVKQKAFSEAIKEAVNDHYDIGMPSVLYGPNSGSVLTYFSLYQVLTEMGYSVLPFIQPKSAKKEINKNAIDFCAKWLPAYAKPRQYHSISDMYLLNQKCDMFIVGSDQIFLESMSHSMDDFFFLQYTELTKPKMAYASSFGGPGARGSEQYYKQLTYYLNRFTTVTCREDDGVKFVNNKLKLQPKVQWVLDPIFLCNKSIWKKMIDSADFDAEQPYIGAYFLKNRPENFQLLREVKQGLEADLVYCMGKVKGAQELEEFHCECMDTFPIENNLALIQNSSFFITDSFHGVCLSLILEKDFLVIPRDFNDRFTSILGRLGLESRIINRDFSNFNQESLQPIDWKAVTHALEELKTQSMDILQSGLKDLGGKQILDYETLRKQNLNYEKEIEKLKEQNSKLKRQLEEKNNAALSTKVYKTMKKAAKKVLRRT